MTELEKIRIWDQYRDKDGFLHGVQDENPSHRKLYFFDDCTKGNHWWDYYTNIEPFLIYYLNILGVDVVVNRYIDTIVDDSYKTQGSDRYIIYFYRNGKKLHTEHNPYNSIYLTDEKPIEKITYNHEKKRIYYYIDEKELWEVTFKDVENVFSLGLSYQGMKKQISLTTDEQGNIVIYFDEKAKELHYISGKSRCTGKKYYIMVGTSHKRPQEYIDSLVSLINRKANNEDTIKMFEILLHDPRLKNKIAELLLNIPFDLNKYYARLRAEIELEYQTKMSALNKEINAFRERQMLLDNYPSGLVPQEAVDIKKD